MKIEWIDIEMKYKILNKYEATWRGLNIKQNRIINHHEAGKTNKKIWLK